MSLEPGNPTRSRISRAVACAAGVPEHKLADRPIAIVGLSALFPKARNLRQYWSNIVDAADCIEEVPESHWRIGDYYDPDPAAEDKTYCRRGGFLPEINFNPVEFGIPPNTIEVTDVLQLLSLVVARQLLEDAGCHSSPHYDPKRTGVILGVTGANSLTQPLSARLQTPVVKRVVKSCGLSERDADEIAAKLKKAYIPWAENSFPGMLGNVVAGRIANRFDLGATNCTVDAACASSLAAVRMAIGELLEGRADMMITGGCDAENTILMYMCFSKTPAFSKSGVVRPFDEGADGTLIGEGLGMLALKRLADAERQNDRIYAVIRGLGSSSDGRFKSIYAPRREGQMLALRRAYADARCAPDSIGLVEAHGTGTAVGDQTELSALAEVYGESTAERQFAAIGSVKSQIGHTKAAAGAAGLIKLSLALYHKVLPPTLNVRKPNPEVRFDETAFYVGNETRPWIQRPDGVPRRAAISSFGFGGTNFHVVLEEHPQFCAERVMHSGARAFVFSAENGAALRERLLKAAGAWSEVPPADPIPASHPRLGFAAATEQEYGDLVRAAADLLAGAGAAEEASHPKGIFYRSRALAGLKPVAMFAGQGSQYVNMGRAAALNIPLVRDVFDRMNRLFAGAEPLSNVVFPPPVFGDSGNQRELSLRRTDYAQPALAALSAGQYRFARAAGFAPAAVLGHSFGELSALWAAGCLSDADYFLLARERGRAMAPPADSRTWDAGAMTAVAAPAPALAALLAAHPDVRICNYNSPSQVVAGGPKAAVGAFTKDCEAAGLRASALPVSAAFHTPLVAHAVERFRHALDSVEFDKPHIPVTSNTEGRAYSESAGQNKQLLADQLLNPVCFEQQILALYAAGHRVFVEFGPKSVLSKLVDQILQGREHWCVPFDAGPARAGDAAMKQACAHLKVLGVELADLNSNLDRPADTPEQTSAATIRLNGVNYVSPARRAAFETALANGYRVPAPPPAVTAPAAMAADEVRIAPAASPAFECTAPEPPKQEEFSMSLQDELMSVHVHFMEGQLDVSKKLARALETGAPADGLGHVARHAIELGHVHTRASEIFSDMLKLAGPVSFVQFSTAPPLSLGAPACVTPAPRAAAEREREASAPPPVTALPAAPLNLIPATAAAPSVARKGEMETSDIASVVISAISEATGYPAETLNAAMDLEADLGIDSIKRVEIMGKLKEAVAIGHELAPEAMGEIRNIGDIIALFGVGGPAIPPATVAPAQVAAALAAAPAPTPSIARKGEMEASDIASAVIAAISEATGYPAETLNPRMDLEADLGIDSIKRVEIMGKLKDGVALGHEIAPEAMGEIKNIGDIVALFGGGAAAAPPQSATEAKAQEVPGPIVQLEAALEPLPAADRIPDAYGPAPSALIVGDAGGPEMAFGRYLSTNGWNVETMDADGIVNENSFDQWSPALGGRDGLALCVYALTGRDPNQTAVEERLKLGLMIAKRVQQALEKHLSLGRSAFIAITRQDGSLGFAAPDPATCAAGGISGLVKTLAIEAPGLFCRVVDVAPQFDPEEAADALWRELHDPAAMIREVGVSREGRVTIGLRHPSVGAPTAVLGTSDLLVVTGGARGVTAACVTELARKVPCGFILLGRTAPGEIPEWAVPGAGEAQSKQAILAHRQNRGLSAAPRDIESDYRQYRAQEEIRATLAGLRAAGAEAHYVAADIADIAGLRNALAAWLPRITGVIHGAGVLADKRIADKSWTDVARVFEPKLSGLRNVLSVIEPDRIRHLALFSSVAGLFGNRGQSDYAIANEALNKIALSLKCSHPDLHVTSINWGAWDGGMVSPQLKKMFEERGIALIPRETGARMFAAQFLPERAGGVVSMIGPNAPLSAADPAAVAGTAISARRMSAFTEDSLILDHALGGHPVFPATYALGWMMHAAERTVLGSIATGAADFQVLKGIVFDGAEPDEVFCDARVTQSSAGAARGANVDLSLSAPTPSGIARKFYRTAVTLSPAASGAPGIGGFDAKLGSLRPADPYESGTLFHGPALRGIRRASDFAGGEMLLECRLDSVGGPAGAACAARLYHPALADMLLQSTLVLARAVKHMAGLPMRIAGAEFFRPLAAGETFWILLDEVSAGESQVQCRARACDSAGRVLIAFSGVTVSLSSELGAKFAAGTAVTAGAGA